MCKNQQINQTQQKSTIKMFAHLAQNALWHIANLFQSAKQYEKHYDDPEHYCQLWAAIVPTYHTIFEPDVHSSHSDCM
jgi:hypothetical protein